MIENPYRVGDLLLASRAEDGRSHEQATVVDAYVLIIEGDERPMVCVEFSDGARVYLRADGPDVKPRPSPDEAQVGS
jgi:hypothetical protein